MNPRPDPDHLASAYLDGELTADERALVEASPDLMRLVEAMRSVRTALRHVPVEQLHRSGAVQAALAEYDRRVGPTGSPVAPASPVSLDQRRRLRLQSRVLAAAAAVLLVGVVGVSVLGNDEQSVDTSGAASRTAAPTAGDMAVTADSFAPGQSTPTAETASEAGLITSTIGAINQPASAALVVTDAESLLALPDPVGGEPLVTGCPLDADEVVVARIVWVDATAWAIRSTTTGAMRVLDLSCATLATASP